MKWYLDVLKKYAVFEGRTRRKEYWMFQLFTAIIVVALVVADAAMGTISQATYLGPLSGLYILATLLPNLAVLVRRLHDTNRSGWWALLSLVPLLGIVVLVFTIMDSDPGDNRFGRNPKGPIQGYGMPAAVTPQHQSPPMYSVAQAPGSTTAEQSVNVTPQTFCSNCGTPLSAGSRFCASCGKPA